jgi:3-methyladenine DNA glycosylase Mpg
MILFVVAAIFVVLIVFSMPIVFALGVSGVAGLAIGGYDMQVFASSMVSGSQSWVLLAIPAFVFAGGLMEKCGMSHALVDFARALVGWVKGGLGMSVIVVAYFFSDICGSKMAEVSALGATLMPPLRRAGYRPEDGASHAAFRPSSRWLFYGPGGIAYVFRAYGLNDCLNAIAGPRNTPGCVLIRALEPLTGIASMARRRKRPVPDRESVLGLAALLVWMALRREAGPHERPEFAALTDASGMADRVASAAAGIGGTVMSAQAQSRNAAAIAEQNRATMAAQNTAFGQGPIAATALRHPQVARAAAHVFGPTTPSAVNPFDF